MAPSLSNQSVNAQTLGTRLNLSGNTGGSILPEVTRSGDNYVYVVWKDYTTGNGDIYFKRSIDAGKTFGSLVKLSANTGISETPKIVATGSYVYVVWRDYTTGNGDIYFRVSSNYGSSFGSTKNLSNNIGVSAVPQIRVQGTSVFVAWSDDNGAGGRDIYFKRSTNNGVDFGSKLKISSSGKASQPTISSQGTYVYVAWRDASTGNGDIYFKRSTTAGVSFGAGSINLSNNAGDSRLPIVKSAGTYVYFVWRDATTGDGDIYFKRSTDNGATLKTLRNLSADEKRSGLAMPLSARDDGPDIIVAGTNVYVAWSNVINDDDPDFPTIDIIFRKLADNGLTLSSKKDISNSDSVINLYPRISASGNYVYITWVKNSDSEESFEADVSRSSNAGDTFGIPIFVAGAERGQGGMGGPSDIIPHSIVVSSTTGKAYIVTSEIFYGPMGVNTNNEITFRTVS